MHRATSHDGRQLAVKVQHAGLRETAAADVATIEVRELALYTARLRHAAAKQPA